ncbi:DUF881 domain-containing protein [Lysinibacillus endophyticus]|uniref:DUF881 domain-containing protein n=2 Tax=Ureibacillus endophyticus TaxID=1978490 RepID=A0A494ZAY4_9BACL|nr:DUF881 domain-containing protein [Lysinibacillus endophyticus]
MIAVQYNTIQNPAERDTRDLWEIRQELSEEKKRHSELLSEIVSLKSIVNEYENDDKDNQAQILKNTVEDLKIRAGLEAVSGPGVILKIEPAMELVALGLEVESIPPDLLIRLVNEIYRYHGIYIEIDGQRLVHTSAIRDINGKTTINGFAINKSNVEIRVITESYEKAEKLYGYLYASTFSDDFYLDNLHLIINKPVTKLTIQEYDGKLSNTFLVENNKGE